MTPDYFTILVPFIPSPDATEWHPTESTGKWSVLTRGSFPTVGAALTWARKRLNGTPYTIVSVTDEGTFNLNGTRYVSPFEGANCASCGREGIVQASCCKCGADA